MRHTEQHILAVASPWVCPCPTLITLYEIRHRPAEGKLASMLDVLDANTVCLCGLDGVPGCFLHRSHERLEIADC